MNFIAFKRFLYFSSCWLAVLALFCAPVAKGEDGSTTAAGLPAIVKLTDLPILADDKEGEGKTAPDKEKDAWLWVNRIPAWLNRKEVTLGGRVCKTWLLVVHGSLSWNYALKGEYFSLVADLAQQDGMKAHLQILGDGKQLYDSGYLPQMNHPITALVDLRGVKTLKISVADVEDGIPWNDRVFFGNPVLIRRTLPTAANTAGRSGSTPPLARIAASPTSGSSPFEVKFTGDQSKAPAGQVGRYTWTFGDGETETLAPNPSHKYTQPGIYEAVLQAEDDKGGIGVARELITVRPSESQPPIALARAMPLAVRVKEVVRFDASDSSSTDGSALTFHWDFGDGQKGGGKKVSHAFQSPARYKVLLTVSTSRKQEACTAVSVKASGNPPSPVFPLQKGARVLIIGNSLVGFSGPLDEWLMFLDKISPQPLGLQTASRGKGLGKLVEYATWRKLAVHEKINEGWDVVIIQPWIDAIDDKVSDEELLKDAKTLVDWVKESGAYPVLYEPQLGWRDMEKNQKRGHERIRHLAEVLDTGFIPAGQAWLKVAKDYPVKKDKNGNPTTGDSPAFLHPYMYSDFGHQSFNGSLFNSLMIWKYLTGQSPTTVKVTAGAPNLNKSAKVRIVWDRVGYLKKIADESITPASERVR